MNTRRGRALAGLLLITALIAGCASGPPEQHTGAHPAASVLSARSHRTPRERTVHLVRHLLSQVSLPSGARSRSSAPVRELRHPATSMESPNFVDRRTWWVVPGSVPHLLHFVKKHEPRGCHPDGSGTLSGPHQRTTYSIFCSAGSTGYAAFVELAVEAVAIGGGSAVRADAQAVWIPRRPAYSRIIDASAAHVVVERHATPGRHRLPTVRRTLDAHQAARIAAAIDRLAVSPPVTISCPADFAGVDDQLRFATPAGAVHVYVGLTGCPGVTVRVSHHPPTDLDGAGAVDAAVRHVLHLPRGYRRP